MKICFFGEYDSNYSRNRIIIKGLKKNKLTLKICNAPMKPSIFPSIKNIKEFIISNISLYKQHLKMDYDFFYVGYPLMKSIWLGKLITKKKIIIN